MANGFPVKTSFQASDPLAASQLNALGEAINQSAAGVATTAGDIVYASAANTLARIAKGTAGQVLRMNSGATAPEWGSGIVAYTAKQTSSYALTTSMADITGMSVSVTTIKANSLVVVFACGDITTSDGYYLYGAEINSVADANPCGGYLRNLEGFGYVYFDTVVTPGTFDVSMQAKKSTGTGSATNGRMIVLVI